MFPKNRAWLRPDHFYGCDKGRPGLSCGWNSGVGVRGRTSCSAWSDVSVKTFSVHVAVVLRLVVSGKRFSAHERVRGNRKIGEKRQKNIRGNRVNERNQKNRTKEDSEQTEKRGQ